MTGTGRRYQRAGNEEQVTRVDILESKLDHGRTAAHGRGCTRTKAIDAVAEVVGDGDQPQHIGNQESGIGNRNRREREAGDGD